jgi:hypothetical protein
VEKYGTARQAAENNIIRFMRFACKIPKATDVHPEFVIFFPTVTIITRTPLSVTFICKFLFPFSSRFIMC